MKTPFTALPALFPAIPALALGIATAAHGAEIQETLVTASLLPIPESEVASSFTVLNRQYIDNRAPLLISDILRDVPGMAVSRNGVLGSSTQVRVRGAEANHLLVLVDGVEVNDPGQGDELNWGTLTASDIERVEIVRGPQSALYGSDAVAGVVNIITQGASAPFSAGVFSEAGSFNTFNNGVHLGATSDRFHGRITASHMESDGDNISRTGTEDDGYKNTNIGLKAGATLTDALSLHLSARQSDGRTDFDETDFATGLPADANSYTEFFQRNASLHVEYSALDGAWVHRLGVNYNNNDNDNFSFNMLSGSNESTKKQYQYLTSYNWSDKAQSLSLLLEREEEEFHQRGQVLPWGDPNQDRQRDTDSVALEYRGTYFDRLTLSLSGRQDDNSEFDNADAYRAELAYQLTPATRLRAATGKAIKNPTFSERFGFFTNFVGNPDLKPEQSKSWEVGVDQSLIEGKVKVSATYFEADLENEIDGFVWNPVSFGYTARNKDGKSQRDGLELSLNASLTDTLTLYAAYTYIDATEEDAFTGEDVNELRRPDHIGSVSLGWQPRGDWQFNINAQYSDEQKDNYFPPYPPYSELVTLDSYTLVNLNATYSATDQLDIYLKVENALDEQYEEVYGYQTLGAGGYIGFRYNFVQ